MLLPRFKRNETKVVLIIATVGDPRHVQCALNTNRQRKLYGHVQGSPKHLAEKNAEFGEPQGKEVREKGQKGKKKKRKHDKNLEQPVDGAVDSVLSNFVRKEPTTLAPETSLEHTGGEWEVQIFSLQKKTLRLRSRVRESAGVHTHLCPWSSPTLQPFGLQPARLLCPWDFPGKNPGWVTISPSRRSSHSWGIKHLSPMSPCTAGRCFTRGAIRKVPRESAVTMISRRCAMHSLQSNTSGTSLVVQW